MLNARQIEYLLIGGYAVGYHGYPRATADLDIWIATHPRNAAKVIKAVREFGFPIPKEAEPKFQQENQIFRMGLPPVRLEITTSISGVNFDECFAERIVEEMDGIPVNIISLKDLRRNKKASGRFKDLDDLEHLKGADD